jgi:hypothetical protein
LRTQSEKYNPLLTFWSLFNDDFEVCGFILSFFKFLTFFRIMYRLVYKLLYLDVEKFWSIFAHKGGPLPKKKSDGIAAAGAGSLKIVCVIAFNKYLKNI